MKDYSNFTDNFFSFIAKIAAFGFALFLIYFLILRPLFG
jgi:hypothetical protein